MTESTGADEIDLDGLATAFNDLVGQGLQNSDAYEIVSAEAAQAITPIMIAEAVSAASSIAVSEAMEAVALRTGTGTGTGTGTDTGTGTGTGTI